MKRLFPASAVLAFATFQISAATYYVSLDGSDANSGTATNAAYATPQKAMSVMLAGDTTYVRGGVYALATQVKANKAGTATNHCVFSAYPGEKPVFSFSGTSIDGGLYIGKDYWHVTGIEVENCDGGHGITISGAGFVILEGCVSHDNQNDGIYITSGGHDSLVLNCDSYRNFQASSSGQNGDGFSCKTGCGSNNVYMGCRAWNNADDGWDFYDDKTNAVSLQGCWSFRNGYNLWGVSNWLGNGNGFKLGGASTYALHIVKQCVAFENVHKGFDQNYNGGVLTVYNCTGYSNEINFAFQYSPTNGTPPHHVLKNNISYARGSTNLASDTIQISNSWQGFTVSSADFSSLTSDLALSPRNADYTLPNVPFLRLTSTSSMIDKGTNVGLPFNGAAPDLGAFEYSAAAQQTPCWFAACRWTNSGFAMQVNGLTSHGPIILFASTDLRHWSAILTNPPVTGTSQFLDTSAANSSYRFYRAQEQ